MILDTNALSDWAERNPRLEALVHGADALALNSISVGEYFFGLRSSRMRVDLEAWMVGIIREFPVLPITLETATHYAELRDALRQAGTPIPQNDLWIAALARQHTLPLLSRDSHFDAVPDLKRVAW